VTDIYLPRWIAAHSFTYNAPLVALAAVLHGWILLARRSGRCSRAWDHTAEAHTRGEHDYCSSRDESRCAGRASRRDAR
jgi:hypothetical protein